MNASGTGIGRALRTAREVRGKSLEEASRETRIRPEYLRALEREAFEHVLGDVYVRGFLRSYSTYLGLDADHVLGAYARTYGAHRPTPPRPPSPSPTVAPDAAGHPLIHRRANWKLAAGLAVLLLAGVIAAAVAWRPSPDVAAVGVRRPAVESSGPVVANVTAQERDVAARIVVDGEVAFEGTLARGEARSFEGARSIRMALEDGGAVRLDVNGMPLGAPAEDGQPFEAGFTPEDYRRSPSSGGG